MPPEFFTAISTLAVALVAGFISYIAGRGMKTHEWKLAQAKEEISARKALYSSFLAEAQRLVVQSTESKNHKVSELDKLQEQYAEITLVGSGAVVETAKFAFDSVLLAHLREQDVADAVDFHARKQAFVEAARAELQAYRVSDRADP